MMPDPGVYQSWPSFGSDCPQPNGKIFGLFKNSFQYILSLKYGIICDIIMTSISVFYKNITKPKAHSNIVLIVPKTYIKMSQIISHLVSVWPN